MLTTTKKKKNQKLIHLFSQIEIIEDLTASTYDTSSNPANNKLSSKNANTNLTLNLKLSILQTDLVRTQYLIRSLLRQRLSKLAKHAMHYLILISPPSNHNTESQKKQDTKLDQRPEDTIPNPAKSDVTIDPSPLSHQEAAFIYSHQHLLASHYGSSFLNTFPPQLRRLDDNAGGTSMVQGPDLKEVAFVRCLAEEVRIVIPADDTLPEEVLGMTMRRGELWVTRWEGVKKAWERGDVEIL